MGTVLDLCVVGGGVVRSLHNQYGDPDWVRRQSFVRGSGVALTSSYVLLPRGTIQP